MTRSREIEEVFLYTLREESPKDEISKRIKYFGNYQWQALYELATHTYLFPAFYKRLLSLNLKNTPPEFLAKLKNLYLLNLKRNILLEQELFRILAYFKELNIPVMPIKGPILTRYLYDDVGLRQASCDLDLLVKYETINQAKDKLRELDYGFSFIEQKRDFLHPVNLSREVEQIVLAKSIDSTLSIILDLHWCIRGFFLDNSIKELWREARYYNLDGQRILMLSNEDNLIYLSLISISTLEFVQLKYLYDIHKLVTVFGKELDWGELLYKIGHSNLENCLYFPLNLSKILFLTDIPEEFLDKIKPDWITRKLISAFINKRSILDTFAASKPRPKGRGNVTPLGINPEPNLGLQAGVSRRVDFRQKVKINYPLRYLLGRYLYSDSSADFLRKSFRRISS